MSMKMSASSDRVSCWKDFNFPAARARVKKLQSRIAQAFGNGDNDKVILLQEMLIHSFNAKALAVDVVTSNKGKNTSGVDNVVWTSPEDKFRAIDDLTRRGYKPLPLRRVYIPKSNGDMRPLNIPAMKDRAIQTLYKFALEPIAEITADKSSYGFRRNLSARDAVIRCMATLSDGLCDKWVMKADIKSCFDNISHEWIMEHIPMDKVILWKFLKCGYVDNAIYYPTVKGVPQGGCLSGIICNMCLDGLENILVKNFGQAVHMVRYADDIVIVADTQNLLVRSVTPAVDSFLDERGLELSKEKTYICNIKDGFGFLGFEIYKENNQIFAVPLKRKIEKLTEKVEILLSAFSDMPLEEIPYNFVIGTLNSLKQQIEGWFNYYNDVADLVSLKEVACLLLERAYQSPGGKLVAEIIDNIFFESR